GGCVAVAPGKCHPHPRQPNGDRVLQRREVPSLRGRRALDRGPARCAYRAPWQGDLGDQPLYLTLDSTATPTCPFGRPPEPVGVGARVCRTVVTAEVRKESRACTR